MNEKHFHAILTIANDALLKETVANDVKENSCKWVRVKSSFPGSEL